MIERFGRRNTLIALGLLAAAAIGLFFWLRGGDAGSGDDRKVAAGPGARRMTSGSEGEHSGPPPTTAPVAMENDPEGPLRLEGQVLGPDDQPVAGATVTLGSIPPRTASSDTDGSFGFDKLIGRTYALTARSGDLVGGPVMHTLRESSDPVVIRVKQGAVLEVTVVAEGTGKPIAGASVNAGDDASDASGTTDAKGVALLKGITPGTWTTVSARAAGFGPGHTFTQVSDAPGAVAVVRLELRRGAPVSGVVIGEGGQPIAGARVAARDVSLPWGLGDDRDKATTDAKGVFTLPAVAAGTYRFNASHAEHAPGSSEPVTVDGAEARDDVRITLAAGGVAAGKVVDASGAPVPWATVRIGAGGQPGAQNDVATRQVIAGEEGAFELKGLPRRALTAIALSESASSAPLAVDLTSRGEERSLVLKLDVTGTISGVVIDGAGEPVAEAQVSAYPDFFAGEVGDDFALRGPSAEGTDGDGRFVLRGLPDGAYRLYPSRGGMEQNPFARKGTKAKTGDANVRLVLQADGAVTGKVLFEDGSAPQLFTVSIGWAPGLPVAKSDGSFNMPSVAPGKHDLTVRGPEFAETMVRDVAVASGQTKDIGTVKVKRGRNVSGRVLAADGKPVAGATVVLGDQIFGDGKSLASSSMAGFEDAMGLRKTTSDGDGRYFLRGIGDKQLVIAAEHESQGRSPVQTVSAGGGSAEIDLRLAGTGSVSGLVRAGGKPASGAQMIATATTSAKQNMMVTTGADGLYQFARLAAGQYKITAMLGGGLGGTMASRTVVVKPGQKSTVDIDIAVGDLTLTVTIQPKSGTIDSAQIYLFDGAVSASTAKELQEKVIGGSDSGAKVELWTGGPPKTFKEVAAGVKSICVIPITGDISDMTFAMRLQEHLDSLRAYCSRHEMKASPAAQSTTLTVPPMDPLPAPPSP